MFRSKKKKTQGRKRREATGETDVEAGGKVEDVGGATTGEIATANDPVGAENDLQVLEELRRSRARGSANGKSAMTFSSKSAGDRVSSGNGHATVAAASHVETGLLSFDAGESRSGQKKRKMRPNLVVSSAVDVQVETETSRHYSAEMLASLRSEQTVLLPATAGKETANEDVEMEDVLEVEAGNDVEVEERVLEEEEEFISLNGGKSRRGKSRLTFGMHSEGPDIAKTTEVVEEISGEEDEDDEQNRRWEEELMRRGGHRVPPPSQSNGNRSRDGLPTYPTRRKVACVSLGSVLGKLEKGLESTSFEDERASRELARLEAETALIETTLKQQQEEILVSSEEFEYFQEIEDFVKGLSYCLREKIPVIDAKERKIIEERVHQVQTKRDEEQHGVEEDLRFYLNSGRLQQADVFCLSQLTLDSNGDITSVLPTSDRDRSSRLLKYRQHFTESYSPDQHLLSGDVVDLFSDAIDEINSLDRVYGRFQEWKAKFPEVYKTAFCELAQEKLFAPYVQAELLGWDPLSVADVNTELGKSWSLNDFAWFRILHQHLRQPKDGSDSVNGPILYQLRVVLLEKARVAVTSYFDPYSSLQVRSVSLLLEEINRHGYSPHVRETVQTLVSTALDAFSSEANKTVLIAADQSMAESCKAFASYLIERFNALQDNLLTLFVALPQNNVGAAAFRCLLQLLHHLLAYLRHCQETQKMQLVPTATQVIRQLSGSSYLLQILSEPSQERELKHIVELFEPFLQKAS
ncbi:unnamed protein product [Phytophthora lilii]|uniref:Unnamed protein product n=1 Tax=Phytophthora lilii TaxID=2077276 RepID=A0A9W6TE64_9STRA|nr:unnamed protein product [Phytophthora lilii]